MDENKYSVDDLTARLRRHLTELEEMQVLLSTMRMLDVNQLNMLRDLLKNRIFEDSTHTKLVYRGVE